MAKELLVTRDLNREMIDAGAWLVEALESIQFNATALLWQYKEESERWRFVVGSPEVERIGPRKVYETVQTLLDDLPDDSVGLTLSDVSAVGDKTNLVRALRAQASDPHGVKMGQLRGGVRGAYFADSYIYKVKPLEPKKKKT